MTPAADESARRLPADPAETRPDLAAIGLRARDAARLLGISERLLWQLTNAREVPHLRLGRAVIYPRRLLERWLEEQARKAAR